MNLRSVYGFLLLIILISACQSSNETAGEDNSSAATEFNYLSEQFADLKIIRYQIPGFDRLSLDQKKLVFYLTQAGLAGRDITWDQNYRHNLEIRKALENIVRNYSGDKNSAEWEKFMEYTKRVWFANGIHHHYSREKFNPAFTRLYFEGLLNETGTTLSPEAKEVMFIPELDSKMVNKDPEKGLLKGSATNYYAPDITSDEVEAFYAGKIDKTDDEPVEYGLNSSMIRKADGSLEEVVWKADGLYGPAIQEIIGWLEKAVGVAENEKQAEALRLLIEYYKTGDLEVWDQYNIAWVNATEGDIDYINGFIEVYDDPLGYRGYFESIVEINDFEASERMAILAENAQWFEDNSPIMDEHKKAEVVGVSYKVVNVAGESGAASPATPIGVNLPNNNWIRAKHGSKSVSLGNIVEAYNQAGSTGLLEEFYLTDDMVNMAKEYGQLSSKLHTALHEVIGHASGKLNPGVGTPKETLKNYASTLEEGRADLVAMYFLMDQKLIDLGVMPSLEVGKVAYNSYINNGMMMQLRRIEPGRDIEEAHMRNRQWVAGWVYDKGKSDQVIERVVENDKTYFRINDYEKLRELFGDLLREVQRIKSEGDFEAGQALVETYGVKVDQQLHREVLERAAALKSAPYGGFINPVMYPKTENGEIIDIEVTYPDNFTEQMLFYAENHSFLD